MRIFLKIFIVLSLFAAASFLASAQTDSTEVADEFTGAEFDPEIAAENGYEVTIDEAGNYKVKSTAAAVWDAILGLLKLFLFNLAVSFIIVQFLYYPKSRRVDYYFTFMVFSSAMFLLLFVMNNLSLQIGFTIGLFAIFGMIRYRTETVPVREMTYLFIIIAVSVINGIGADIPFGELVAANVLLILLIWVLESKGAIGKRTSTKLVIYDKIDLIVPERRAELVADLEKRTGMKIRDIQLGQVDFLKDSAWLKVTYELENGQDGSLDGLRRTKDFE